MLGVKERFFLTAGRFFMNAELARTALEHEKIRLNIAPAILFLRIMWYNITVETKS